MLAAWSAVRVRWLPDTFIPLCNVLAFGSGLKFTRLIYENLTTCLNGETSRTFIKLKFELTIYTETKSR